MAESTYLVSTVLMGLVLVAIVAGVLRLRDWQQYSMDTEGASDTLAAATRNPAVWTGAFLLLALGATGGALLLVTQPATPSGLGNAAQWGTIGLAVTVLGAFVFVGVYRSIRYRGMGSAQAAAVGLWVFGVLFIAAVVLNLVFGT